MPSQNMRRAKIVEGRLQKIQDEMALVNQESLTDPNVKVSEIIKQTIAAVGENIQVSVQHSTVTFAVDLLALPLQG